MSKKKKENLTLWLLLPVVFTLLQAFYTFNSMTQIRYEELAESVRNPFWMQNRLMYDGMSGSLAWYGILAVVYNIFGYSLFTAKVVRLLLFFGFCLSLTLILKRFLSLKQAIIPLLVICLSPTLLFFNTLQSTYGMDLEFLPITILTLISIDYNAVKEPRLSGAYSEANELRLNRSDYGKKKAYLFEFILGFLAVIASLSYPTFIFYLVGIFGFYVLKLIKSRLQKISKVKHISITILGFLLPLLFFYIYLKNGQFMILDPHNNSGIFRGAGILQFDFNLFWRNIQFLLDNLFHMASGYYYEVLYVEFSHYFPIIAVIFLTIFIPILYRKSYKSRVFIILIALVFLFNLVMVGFSKDLTPGLRRYTPAVATIYGFFCLSWVWVLNLNPKKYPYKKFLITILTLIPLHHVLVYLPNLNHIDNLGPYRDFSWFAQAETPEKSLKGFVERVQKDDLSLACIDESKQFTECRYPEIYAAVAGSCLWNKLECHKIYGYDEKSKKFIELKPELWKTYYFQH